MSRPFFDSPVPMITVAIIISASFAIPYLMSTNDVKINRCKVDCAGHHHTFIEGECHCKVDNGWAAVDALVLVRASGECDG